MSQLNDDTHIGGPKRRFPTTRQSLIVALRSSDRKVCQRAMETVVAAYWKPAYKYVRIKWQASNEDAKDLTQGFFATAIEKNYFARYDARKASFQTFLRTCLDRFIANEKKGEQRLKRGGGANHFSFDFATAENELILHQPAMDVTPEDHFHREWVRSIFDLAIETLRQQYMTSDRALYFKVFERYDLRDDSMKITYADVGAEFGLSTIDVTNHLAAARRDFRQILLQTLRRLTGTEDEFRTEARSLLGIKNQ